MAYGIFNPKGFLIHLDPKLLETYAEKRDIDLKSKNNENSEHTANRFIAAIEKLDNGKRDRIWLELQGIDDMASERGFSYLFDNAKLMDKAVSQEEMDKMRNYYDRSLWFFLNRHNIFETTADIYELDYITGWKRIPVAKKDKEIVIKKTKELEKAIQSFYGLEFKGKNCKVEHYDRGDRIFFTAFVEDLPTNEVAFERGSLNKQKPRKPVFEAYFLYRPEEGVLEVKTKGGKEKIKALQEIFSETVLGEKIDYDNVQTYDFDKFNNLQNLNFAINPEDGVESVQLKELRLVYPAIGRKITLQVGDDPRHGVEAMQDFIGELRIPLSELFINQAVVQVKFRGSGRGRRRSVTTRLTYPNSCDLRERNEDRVVRELLKRWGIDNG